MSEGEENIEYVNWNDSMGYIRVKVNEHLYKIDECIMICRYGGRDLLEEFQLNDESKNILRLRALDRLLTHLELLIRNSTFGIKSVDDKNLLVKTLDLVLKLRENLPRVSRSLLNQQSGKNEIKIEELFFKEVLESAITIAQGINEPLNRADMIFRYNEEYDPEQAKRDIMKELTETG